MANKPQKFIQLESEKVKEISAKKGVSTPTIYAALKYETDSSLARLIRSWAVENGGRLFREQPINSRNVNAL
jgi:hypothetical protein